MRKCLTLAVVFLAFATLAYALPAGHHGCLSGSSAVYFDQYDETQDSCLTSADCDNSTDPTQCRVDCHNVAESSGNYFANQYYNWCTTGTASNYCSSSSPYC